METARRARRQSIQKAQTSSASGVTTALSRSTGPWAMTVWTRVVSSWTALRMRPEVEAVNHASGAWEMRSTMSRRESVPQGEIGQVGDEQRQEVQEQAGGVGAHEHHDGRAHLLRIGAHPYSVGAQEDVAELTRAI